MHDDRALNYPATQRNRDVILQVLQSVLSESQRVLELASGSGQHCVHFAAGLPKIEWQPSDRTEDCLASIGAWRESTPSPNLRIPIQIDVLEQPWQLSGFTPDAIVCINMIHISPWACTLALFEQAASFLPDQGAVYLYGPFMKDGQHTSDSNARFSHGLQAQNPEWGVRDLSKVIEVASANTFALSSVTHMPANNLSVVFKNKAP